MSYTHILVAIDLSPSSQAVIDKAVALAKSDKCKLSFVYVEADSVVLAPKEQQSLENDLKELAGKIDYPVTEFLAVVGDLHVKLSGLVKEMGVDLVVCGHHHKLLSRLFSSVPKVANAVDADLLVVYLDE